MTIRPAILSDIPAMQEIFAVARQFMVAAGNPCRVIREITDADKVGFVK